MRYLPGYRSKRHNSGDKSGPTDYGALASEFINLYYPSTDPNFISHGVLIAIDFYLSDTNYLMNKSQLFSHLKGIDFLEPVQVVELPYNTQLDQLQDGGFAMGDVRKGNYYSYSAISSEHYTTPTARGISDSTRRKHQLEALTSECPPATTPPSIGQSFSSDPLTPLSSPLGIDETVYAPMFSTVEYLLPKQTTNFIVNAVGIKGLLSKAKSINDNWSIEDVDVSTEGGGAQIYIRKCDNDKILSMNEIRFTELLNQDFKSLTLDDRTVLVKQIYIFFQKANFNIKHNPTEAENIKQRLSDLLKLFQEVDKEIIEADKTLHKKDLGLSLELIQELAEDAIEYIDKGLKGQHIKPEKP